MKLAKKLPLYIILAIIGALIIVWCASLIKCEILTHKYYSDFEYAYTSNMVLGDIEYFKVLDFGGNTAEVYYVSKDMTDANVLSFKKENGIWVQTEFKTIWSTTGSASEVIYPYWWHFVYGGL